MPTRYLARPVSALASFVSGRRTKWVVIALWIVGVIALSPLAAKLGDATRDETASFLPEDAQSTEVQKLLKDRFPGGETTIGLIVYKRDGALTEADRAKIARDARSRWRRRRRARGLRDRRPRAVGGLRGGLRRARHEAAARDGGARAGAAGRDLSGAADRDHPDRRRRARLPGGHRVHLPLRRRGQQRQLELDRHPDRADVRRGDRLLPAARQPLSGGAPPRRGQARGDGARAAPRRPRAARERLHRDRRDAGPAARGHGVRQVARPGVGYRCGWSAARWADAAAGAPDRGRPPGLLAAQLDRRLPAGRRPRAA